MTTRPAPRRAFTLLETMLAAAIGALLVAACAAIFTAIDRHERRLGARSEQVMALARIQTVMRRACTTFVMAPQARPSITQSGRGSAGTAGNGGQDDGGTPAPGPSPADGAGSGENTDLASKKAGALADAKARQEAAMLELAKSLPARLWLTGDPAVSDKSMVRPAEATHAPGPVQRFEMVLTRHPLPTRTWRSMDREADLIEAARRRAEDDGRDAPTTAGKRAAGKDQSGFGVTPPGEGDDSEVLLPEPTGSAVRGVLEVRPTVNASGVPVMVGDRPVSWTLFWQPLTPLPSSRPESERGQPPPVAEPAGPAVEIARDLEYVHWQVFKQRERRAEHRGLWYTDLPAYVEMEVKTIDGITANWMFEVDWVTGSESEVPEEQPDQKDAPAGPGAGRSPAPGAGRDGSPASPFNAPLKKLR